MRRRITAAEYDEILQEDWSPLIRANFERSRDLARRLEEKFAKSTEEGRRYLEVTEWQRKTLQALYKLYALQFDLRAGEKREPTARWLEGARYKRRHGERGMRERLHRARSEAEAGCDYQKRFLRDHAELIRAVQSQMA